jgi:PAS domain S-box-containing protein
LAKIVTVDRSTSSGNLSYERHERRGSDEQNAIMSPQPRILVVDDDPAIRRLLVRLLERAGHEVLTADDGLQAEEIATQQRPDLILLDLMLPERNGLEVCADLKARKETAAIPIIFVTGTTEGDRIVEGFEVGGCDYVVKPFVPQELLARISAHLRLRRTEEELRESEERFRSLVAASKDAMVAVGQDGLITLFNPAAEKMFGRSADEVLGWPLDCLMPEEYREQHQRDVERFFSKGEPSDVIGRTVELPAVRRDGSRFPTELSLSAGQHRGQPFVLATIRDITERKLAEEKLSRVQAAVDDATDAIVIVDQHGTVTYLNAAFMDLFRCTLEIVNEEGWVSLWEDQHVPEKILNAAEHLEKWNGEVKMISTRGRRFPAEIRAAPIIGEGALCTGVLLFINDITERKRAEAERIKLLSIEQERNHLREAVQAQERVLGIVGHELRTPLASVRAMAEFLLQEGAHETEELEEFLRSILDEVIKMAGTVNETLEVARMNSGKAQWNWSEFAVAEVCEQAVETVRPLVNQESVKLGVETTPPDLVMQGDPGAVRRLIVNLLSNAHKHTTDGSINLRAELLSRDNERWVQIQVCDSGAGIPRKIAAKLGEAFALNSGVVGESHVKGAGLGLAICKGIAAAHGGTVSIWTCPGKGTTVTVLMRPDLPEPAQIDSVPVIAYEVQQ